MIIVAMISSIFYYINKDNILIQQNLPIPYGKGRSIFLFTQHQDKPLRSSLSIGFVGDRHYVLFSSFSPFRM